MNWNSQLCSILSEADGSVAKMRERLISGKFSTSGEGLFPVSEIYDSDPPALPTRVPVLRQPPPSLRAGVQWTDLAAIQSQLQIQRQEIESLTQRVCVMERERVSQQYHIQELQEVVHRLRDELREREELSRRLSPGGDRRMEQWSSKLYREQVEHLRREVDQLKTQLRRREDDVLLQQAEARETKRHYDRSSKALQDLTEGYRSHSTDLAKTLSQHSHTQRELHQLSATVSELKNEVRSLRGREPAAVTSAHTPGLSPPPVLGSWRGGVRLDGEPDSDSDVSPTPSLSEISSDDLSWLEDKEPKEPTQHETPGGRRRVRTRRSDFDDGLTSNLEEGGEDVPCDSGSDLSLSDLLSRCE